MTSPNQTFPLVTILLLALLLSPASAITCSDVVKALNPCLNYLKSGSGMPPAPCCTGAKALASATTTTADKQTACTCIKSASKQMNVIPALAKALPGNCGISLGFTLDPNIDCSTIS
ncbi:non-specific lipid-transfer protein 8-like [Actinidia eriantha]|uniref:non-specific lipid-transfer protein 8-like n=1 Tax=Actinidia eriantha TaxID=165200 RepID=UPI002584FAEB|nr:non-specific lipid-transfer protein 8-like [Actinidia eriantha]